MSIVGGVTQIESYVECVLEPGDVAEIRKIRNGAVEKVWCLARDLGKRLATLTKENANGWQIYVGANPRKALRLSGDKNVVLARCIFADFDYASVDYALAKIRAAGLPTPTLMIFSGHGVHAYWRLREPMEGLDAWRAVQKRLIQLLGSDPAIHNPERIMRLPGFTNHKPPRPTLTSSTPTHPAFTSLATCSRSCRSW